MGLKRFVKRVASKSWDANKYLFGGGAVKDVLKKGGSTIASVAKKNPELAGAALTAAGASTGFGDLGGLLGGLGGMFGGGEPAPYEPAAPEAPPEQGLVPGFDNKTLLLVGGVGVALLAIYGGRK